MINEFVAGKHSHRRASVTAIALLYGWLITCAPLPDSGAPTEAALKSLLDERATRDRIELVLGKGYRWYEKGMPSWNANDSNRPDSVNEAAKRYSKLMFYTTMWQRTWIFLDDDAVMRAYFTGSQ